jgi:dTDP-4-dehydrorhamnose 3,5-epimerase
MNIQETDLSGVLLLTPQRHGDARGFFSESWNKKLLQEHGVDIDFVQDNHSLSEQVGTVRGLHFQTPPYTQVKLVRCGRGLIFDVAVDIRKNSPTYGQWVGYELSFENGNQLLVPAGFAHGFVTREPGSEIIYKCSNYYAQECDRALKWDDEAIGIDWGIAVDVALLSDKDANAPALADLNNPFEWSQP